MKINYLATCLLVAIPLVSCSRADKGPTEQNRAGGDRSPNPQAQEHRPGQASVVDASTQTGHADVETPKQEGVEVAKKPESDATRPQGQAAGSTEPDSANPILPADVPKDVLFGTDIVAFSTYRGKKTTPVSPGKYATELGGSTLTLAISRDSSGLKLARTYRDPGRAPQKAEYSVPAADVAAPVMVTDELVLYSYEGGLLVWERKTQIGDMAAAQWVDYERKQ